MPVKIIAHNPAIFLKSVEFRDVGQRGLASVVFVLFFVLEFSYKAFLNEQNNSLVLGNAVRKLHLFDIAHQLTVLP